MVKKEKASALWLTEFEAFFVEIFIAGEFSTALLMYYIIVLLH